jgi:heme exporter protein B
MNMLAAQIRRDLALMWAGRGDAAVMLAFFLIIITLFPLAVGPDPMRLQPVALPVIWIAALLASLAGFPRIFADDVRSGWIDQVALSPLPLPLYALSKVITHWLVSALPMLIATPLMAVMLYVDMTRLAPLILALGIGTLALTLLGVLAAALGEGARNSGGLMAILVLPLAVPILIFGTLASSPISSGPVGKDPVGNDPVGYDPAGYDIITPHLLLLMAVTAVLLAIVPVAAAAALAEAEAESS